MQVIGDLHSAQGRLHSLRIIMQFRLYQFFPCNVVSCPRDEFVVYILFEPTYVCTHVHLTTIALNIYTQVYLQIHVRKCTLVCFLPHHVAFFIRMLQTHLHIATTMHVCMHRDLVLTGRIKRTLNYVMLTLIHVCDQRLFSHPLYIKNRVRFAPRCMYYARRKSRTQKEQP